MRGQMASRQLMQEAHDTELAVELLHETLQTLRSESISELLDAGGSYGPDQSITTCDVFHGQDVRYTTPGYAAGDPEPEVLMVELEVTWVSSTGQTRDLAILGAIR